MNPTKPKNLSPLNPRAARMGRYVDTATQINKNKELRHALIPNNDDGDGARRRWIARRDARSEPG